MSIEHREVFGDELKTQKTKGGRKTKEYKYGNTKRKTFESTIVNMKVFLEALCRITCLKKRLRIVIEYDPQSEDVKTTIQTGSNEQLALERCEIDPMWKQSDSVSSDGRESGQKEKLWERVNDMLISNAATMGQIQYVKNKLEVQIEEAKRAIMEEMPYGL